MLAVASEQEMKARVQEMRAVVEAESEVPLAMAEALDQVILELRIIIILKILKQILA